MNWTLKNHPFAVEAFFKHSIVLTFALPKEELISRIPSTIKLDTYNDQYGFVAVALVDTKNLRPKGFPKFLGNDFFLIGYRVFVRYTNKAGKNLRGLYILKSETNKKRMEKAGNTFTHYNYTTTDIEQNISNDIIKIASKKSDFDFSIAFNPEAQLPKNSPFLNWKEARRFAGPLPFTFNQENKNEILIIEGVRQNWKPQPVDVLNYNFSFFDNQKLHHPVLANAFIIQDIPYYWKKGTLESWN